MKSNLSVQAVTNFERATGCKDLLLKLRRGSLETVRVYRQKQAKLDEIMREPTMTARVYGVCKHALRMSAAEFQRFDSSAIPTVYFAAFGLISAQAEQDAILAADKIGLNLIVENLPENPGGNPANN